MGKGKYADWITKDGLLQIEGWARRGLTNEQIAQNIGVSRSTFQEWLKRYLDMQDALKKGRAPLTIELENALIKKALGYTEVETVVTETIEKGDVTEVRTKTTQRTYPPDTGANIFLLKNRLSEVYQDKPKTQEEKKAIELENEIRGLNIELLKSKLEDDNPEISKLDQLLNQIDYETGEEDVTDSEAE